MEENIVLVCEDSPEGVFTGIYEAYALRVPHERVALQTMREDTLQLFTTYKEIAPDYEKAQKVMRTLQMRFGEEDYTMMCMALCSPAPEKAQAVYQSVVWGLSVKQRGSIFSHLTNDYIRKTMELSRATSNESQHLKGFLRFQELENGLLSSVIRPKNDVLPMLGIHFADRLPMENFIIYDEGRNRYALHPAGGECFLMTGSEEDGEQDILMELTDEEKYYQELFKHFCHNISIKDRENLKLQRNMLPLRFRPYMVEFIQK
ncbi:MAG: TIGR03915 family putative DNA repair protein [Lachnospiraceae bacterium]